MEAIKLMFSEEAQEGIGGRDDFNGFTRGRATRFPLRWFLTTLSYFAVEHFAQKQMLLGKGQCLDLVKRPFVLAGEQFINRAPC